MKLFWRKQPQNQIPLKDYDPKEPDITKLQQEIENANTRAKQFPNKTSLELKSLHLREFPSLKSLTFNLTQLSLSFNFLSEILKEDIINLSHLETLDASCNRLTSIGQLPLKSLKKLDVSHNRLKQFSGIEFANNLEELNLSSNELICLPECNWKALGCLSKVNLEANGIQFLPESFFTLTNLKELYLSNNKLTELSRVSSLASLKILQISRNSLQTLPQELFDRLPQLQFVQCSGNSIQQFPYSLRSTSLLHLNVSENKLQELPSNIHLPSLTSLDLSHNNLEFLPKEIGQLTSLTLLLLPNNKLKELPREIKNLSSLVWLNVSFNCLRSLPSELQHLTQLKRLHANDNELESIPVELTHLVKNFRELELCRNKFLELPEEFLKAVKSNSDMLWNCSLPDQILPNLYLGSEESAWNIDVLRHLGVTHVVMVLNTRDPPFPKEFKYLHIRALDSPNQQLSNHFDEAFEFIHNARTSGTVLVHCSAGISRSATITTAYIMREMNLSLEEALKIVKAGRPKVNPNRGFISQLKEYQIKLQHKVQTNL